MNLCGQPNKGIVDCYSPAQVVKAREYQEQKEALKAAEEEAKLERKIKRAANALKNKLEKERKAKERAERGAKMAKGREAKGRATVAKKTPKTQPNCTVPKAKKAAPRVSNRTKALPKVKAPVELPVQPNVVLPDQGVVPMVVGARKTATRTISLPQRFK